MMSSLFSSFDPCASSFLFLSWASSLLLLIFLPFTFWLNMNRYTLIFFTWPKNFHSELKLLLNKSLNGATLFLTSILLLIGVNNVMGLFPYIFTSTSHLVMALSLAAPLWVCFMIFGWVMNTNHMFTHLVPLNTPFFLMPFMVLIESISNLIRPGTLTVRLTANMIAGHLLLTLLSSQTAHSPNLFILVLLLGVQVLLLTLESAVALIQAYVFTVLSSLYSSEV